MAIIRASKAFEGSELTQKSATYIKSNTRIVDFKNKENGVYLFLLGAYKEDSAGNGVWYKPIKIRDNYGMSMYKKKFAIQPNCPIEYFANKVLQFAPDMAKSREIEEDGRKKWIYPVWGRTAWRVLYNAAIFNDYGAGVHVLDLPQSGGASVIDEHVRGKQADGSPNLDITDYEHAVPINIKLDLKVKGQPWKIAIQTQKTYPLPRELADTDYLYNLDEVIAYPDKQALIDELKSLVPVDIFRKGLEGYSDGLTPEFTSTPETPEVDVRSEVPPVYENPVASIPRSNTAKTVAPTVSIPKANTEPKASEPVASNSDVLKRAQEFLKNKVK